MEQAKAAVPATSPPPVDPHFSESLFSSLLYDISQQVQSAMENMLTVTSEVDQSTIEITEEIEKCKESGASRQKMLEEERDRVEKAAYAVLEMLHPRGSPKGDNALSYLDEKMHRN